MDSKSITQLIFLVLLLLLSSFFSSAETAFTTVSRIRMRTLAESGNKKAKRVLTITDDMHQMLSAILIGNNIVNLSASSIATSLAIKLFGSMGAGIATGILTLLILIFGEISPKTIATIHADKIGLFLCYLWTDTSFKSGNFYRQSSFYGIFKTAAFQSCCRKHPHDRRRIQNNRRCGP